MFSGSRNPIMEKIKVVCMIHFQDGRHKNTKSGVLPLFHFYFRSQHDHDFYYVFSLKEYRINA